MILISMYLDQARLRGWEHNDYQYGTLTNLQYIYRRLSRNFVKCTVEKINDQPRNYSLKCQNRAKPAREG